MPKDKIAKMNKLGKMDSTVYVVKYLPRSHLIAVLDDSNFRILSRELEFVQEITLKNKKEKITLFCLNMGVYRSNQAGASMQPQTDQICVVTDQKMLYFFETIYTTVGC